VEVPVAAACSIGLTLLKFRKEKSLTLQQLAKKVSLSAAYLSQIEHDKASPSISTLRSLAKALGVRLVDFFEDELINDPVVMTPDKWSRVLIPGWQSDTRRIVHHIGTKRMEPFFTTIPPGGKSKKGYAHPGEEFGFVIEGVLTIIIGGESHEVGPMSSFYFSSALPHSWINQGKKPVRLIWVVSPPSW
jgi:transcriptional regulator with XRE-family HTH domain